MSGQHGHRVLVKQPWSQQQSPATQLELKMLESSQQSVNPLAMQLPSVCVMLGQTALGIPLFKAKNATCLHMVNLCIFANLHAFNLDYVCYTQTHPLF